MIGQIAMMVISFMPLGQRDTIIISGEVRSAETRLPVSAATVTEKGQKVSTFSDPVGRFQIVLPTPESMISFEAPGYLPQTYLFNAGSFSFQSSLKIAVELVPRERQTQGAPFHQSEQQSFVLAEQNHETAAFSRRIFKIVDRRTNKAINGRICLFFTKSLKKQCADLHAASATLPVSFIEKDIIAIEVEADHYQKYYGNLILNAFDGATREYKIKMDSVAETVNLPAVPLKRPIPADKHTLPGAVNLPRYEDKTLYFRQSTYDLSEQGRLLLDTVADMMHTHSEYRLIMTGHTDNVGRAYQNQVLSEYRVRVAYAYLISKGVEPKRMRLSWKGGMFPAVPNLDETSRSKNRRIELEVVAVH